MTPALGTLLFSALSVFAAGGNANCEIGTNVYSVIPAARWGCIGQIAYGGHNDSWSATVDDTLEDGSCVEAWTADRVDGSTRWQKISLIARSCGGPVSGTVRHQGAEDDVSIRMYYRWGSRTAVWGNDDRANQS